MFSLVIIYYDDLSGNLQDLGSRSAFTGEMVYFIFVFHPNILMIYVIKIIKITFHSSFFFTVSCVEDVKTSPSVLS